MLKVAIDRQAAVIIAEMTEQYAQTVEPVGEGQDPLVAIRQQELQIKSADVQRKANEFAQRQEFDREKETMDSQIDQQRLRLQEEALADKTRVAEDRVQTQRDIAALNARAKGLG